MIARETVLDDIVTILQELMGDWEFEGEIREDSLVLEELGLESIDVVALSTEIEEYYQRSLPYAAFLISLHNQERRDFTVGQLADFVVRTLQAPDAAA